MKSMICFVIAGTLALMFTSKAILATVLFTPEQLKADLDTLYVMIDEIHPNMFAYTAQEDFEKSMAKVREQISDEMSKLEFYTLVSPLITSLGDGHTGIAFPYDALDPGIELFPFDIYINHYDSTAVVTRSYLEEQDSIPIGAIISSINGRDIRQVIGDMFAMTSGELLSFKAAQIRNIFRFKLYALYGDEHFTVEYSIDDHAHKIETPGLTHYTIYHKGLNENQEETKPDYSLTIETDGIAIVHFNSFADIPRFTEFIDSVFTVINEREITDLIIDIRNNGGGNSLIGDIFFQYISPVPFNQYGSYLTKISPRQVAFHTSYFGFDYDDTPFGITSIDISSLKELEENPLRFTGNTYLLTSNFSFSSAAGFAWTFSYFDMGIIVGEETGGLPVCYGDLIAQKLPNTDLSLYVSHKKFYHYGATDDIDHGTIPHYPVPASEAMAFTLDMIRGQRSSKE